ncbi:M48 family metalloprotease [Actinomadura sediminis]|uniref:M48 family metalloprotease n=1 Tax=Actinomadura sediminis TaxID=1038904 RepID=A0ABW3EXD3_9ACTN
MKTTLRAMIAVTLLLGHHVIALAVLAGTALAVALLIRYGGRDGTVPFTAVMVMLAVPVLTALIKTVRYRPEPPGGLPLDRTAEPALWAEIDAIARRAGTRPPDDLRLTPEANAAVAEQTRGLALTAGRRHMTIGMPLLETLTVAELRAVLAHELGHYSRRHTLLGHLTHRGAAALRNTTAALHSDDPWTTALRKVFDGYTEVYLRVSRAVRRAQETEADRLMVEISGRDAAASALRTVRTTAAAWPAFLDRHVGPATRHGLAPADVLGGFRALLDEPSRRDELAEILTRPGRTDPHDSHPTLADRLRAIARCPEPAAASPDARPATDLLTDAAAVRARFHRALFGDAAGLDWDELAARLAALHTAEDGLRLLAAAERVTGTAPATLGTLLTDIEKGHGPAIADELSGGGTDPADRRAERMLDRLRALTSSALQDAGHLTARSSWTGRPVRYHGPDGTETDLDALVPATLDPATLDPDRLTRQITELRNRLTAWGADPDHRPAPPGRAGTALYGVLHGLQDDEGGHYDALVLEPGILFVPISEQEATDEAIAELPIRARVQHLLNLPPADLLHRHDTWLLETGAVHKGTFWSGTNMWTLRLLLNRAAMDGTPGDGLLHIAGLPPCTRPHDAREILKAALGPRLTTSDKQT